MLWICEISQPRGLIIFTPILIVGASIVLVSVSILGIPSLHQHSISRLAPWAFRYISLYWIVFKLKDEFGFIPSIGNKVEFFLRPGHRYIK